MKPVTLNDIHIRTELQPGDMGYVIHLHGKLYNHEHQFGLPFEDYVIQSMHEFYAQYNPKNNRVWMCEHEGKIVGFLFLMNRGDAAQLRYFLIDPAYRGIGLGKKLMELFMEFLQKSGYKKCYLLTTYGLPASAHLYKAYGFKLTEEHESHAFGKPVKEQCYDLVL